MTRTACTQAIHLLRRVIQGLNGHYCSLLIYIVLLLMICYLGIRRREQVSRDVGAVRWRCLPRSRGAGVQGCRGAGVQGLRGWRKEAGGKRFFVQIWDAPPSPHTPMAAPPSPPLPLSRRRPFKSYTLERLFYQSFCVSSDDNGQNDRCYHSRSRYNPPPVLRQHC